MLSRIGTSQGSSFSSIVPGKNPLSSVPTVGLHITIRSTSFLKNKSKAIWVAKMVFPDAAAPFINENGVVNTCSFAFFVLHLIEYHT